MRRTTANHLEPEEFPTGCVIGFFLTVTTVIAVIVLLVSGLFVWAIGTFVVVALSCMMAIMIKKCMDRVAWKSDPNDLEDPPHLSHPDLNRPHLPQPLNLSRMSPPRPATQPTPTARTTNQPLSQSPLSLSSQLSHAYYSQASRFSSPFIASQTLQTPGPRSPTASPSAWPTSITFSSLASVPSDYGHMAANLQPPSYPEVAVDGPGLPLHPYTAPTTDERSGEVFGSSTDGLPSYEAAISTWQPPADLAHLTPRDDGPKTND